MVKQEKEELESASALAVEMVKQEKEELESASALAVEMVKQEKEELESASAAHAQGVSRLVQQASETGKAVMSSDSEGANVTRCNCSKCCDSAASPRSFFCTACGKKTFTVSEVREHPTLHGVGVCIDCYNFLLSSPFTKDKADNVEEQCRWCGQGGSIVVCDQCDKVFCESCIVRNYGEVHGLGLILKMNDWQCFCCSPALLVVHVHELNAFREAKTREARRVHLQTQSENAKLLLAQERKERQKRDKEIQTNSQNKNSSVKSINQTSSSKRAVTLDNEPTTCQKKPHRSTEVKEHEDIEKQPAPSATPARVYIRPHQWAEKRREARERRARAAAERLESGVTDLPNNGPNKDQNSNTQAEPNYQGEEGQLLRREGQLDAEQKLPRESASAQVNASEGKGKATEFINF